MSLSPSNREFCPLLFQKALGEETDLTPSTKWLACAYYAVVRFQQDQSFSSYYYSKVESTPTKGNQWQEKFQKKSQFPFCRQTKSFSHEIVLRGIKPCFL